MASTWVVESPDEGGVTALGASITIVEDEPPPPPPLPTSPTGPPPLDEELVVVVSHAVLDGPAVTVVAPDAGIVTVSTPPLQLLVIPTAGSVLTERFGALMVMVEPDCRVAVKLVAPTAMVSIVALEPLTFTLTLFTESTTSVVSVTSLYAANASAGTKRPSTAAVLRSVRMAVM